MLLLRLIQHSQSKIQKNGVAIFNNDGEQWELTNKYDNSQIQEPPKPGKCCAEKARSPQCPYTEVSEHPSVTQHHWDTQLVP